MTCRDVKKLLRYSYLPAAEIARQSESHTQSCTHCNQELAATNLMNTLVSSYGSFTQGEQSHWDDARLVNRIKLRIREINERGAGSWDAAIIAVRGWLIAFGATAILLLVLSSHLASSSSSVNQAASDKITSNNTNWGEELISSNSSPNLPLEEDSENAH